MEITMPNHQAIMETYNRFPVTLVKGKGSHVWDDQGHQYLDFTSGIATCNLGHVPDYVHEKLTAQVDTLWHCSNLYHIPPQQALAQLLVDHSCADQVFFCNSGAEANEGAIKLARKWGRETKGEQAYNIITFKQSFHGRTLATLSATGQAKIQQGFAPLVQGFQYLPYNDSDALETIDYDTTCAILLEVVQGEGGVLPADPDWLTKLASICQKKNMLLMIDEVQTGMGRTGELFGYQHFSIEPDVFTLAKGLGSGFPIGAVLAKQHVAKQFQPGTHGSTFGGNPLAVTAGLATLEYMLAHNIASQANELGLYLNSKLAPLVANYSIVEAIRGMGLLKGLLVSEQAAEIVAAARAQRLLILLAGPNVVRILPPLTTTKMEIDQAVGILESIFKKGLMADVKSNI